MQRPLLDHVAATVSSDRIIATMNFDIIIPIGTIVASFIPLVVILTPTPGIWYERLCSFIVLKRGHISTFVIIIFLLYFRFRAKSIVLF